MSAGTETQRRIAWLIEQRDRAQAELLATMRQRDEAVEVLRDFGTDFLVLCPDSLDSATCYDRDCGSETCAVMRARAIVAKYKEE